MKVGPYHFNMMHYEDTPAEKLLFLSSAIKRYAERKQEIENCETALRSFIIEQIRFLEDDYDCEITFNGVRMDDCCNMNIKFRPRDEEDNK